MRIWAFSFYIFFFSFAILSEAEVSAQINEKTFDEVFSSLKDGSSKVDSLNKLCRLFEDNERSIACEKKVAELAEKINYKKGIAQALNNIGVAYFNLNEGKKALEYHEHSLQIRLELLEKANQNGNAEEIRNRKKDISASYRNIGNAYDNVGNKKKAIEYQTTSLRLSQELKDTVGMTRSYLNIASAYLDMPDYYKAIDNGFLAIKLFAATGDRSVDYANALNNIGLAYERIKEYDKALNYYQKALDINKELENQQGIANMLDNIAIIYLQQGQSIKNNALRKHKFNAALENYSMSLNILEAGDDKYTTALVYNNIGNTYWELNDFPNALVYLNKSLDVYRQLGNKSGIASALNSLATHFRLQKKFDQSVIYGLQALELAEKIKDAEQIKNSSEILSDDYRELKQFEKSLFYFKRYVDEKDTLTNVEGAKKLVQEESRMEFEKKEQQLKLEQEKQNAIAEAENRRQKSIIWSGVIVLLLVIIFSVFTYNRFRLTRKQNRIIKEQKNEVYHKNRALEGANAEIAQKNKDITDSIQYAKRIQRALLASDTLLKKNLPEYFVLYKPKDIVSGDFYWASFVDGKFLIITADCTGHGVPGAFMSLLNISLLNEITLQRKITKPDLILNEVRDQIISTLNAEGTETESKDGMDCMLCTFDFKNNKLEFAAANNPLWILKNGQTEIEEFKPDKQPVGFHSIYKPFTLQTTSLEKGDTIYCFTDGFADQFGGQKGKKFKYRQLEELVLGNSHKSMNEQKNALDKTFESWKGDLEQTDDVLVIGIRI